MLADDILTTKQVAKEYGFNYGTLRYWRSANQGPESFTLGMGGSVRYRRSAVERWLAEVEEATRRGDGVELEAEQTTRRGSAKPTNGHSVKGRRHADPVTA